MLEGEGGTEGGRNATRRQREGAHESGRRPWVGSSRSAAPGFRVCTCHPPCPPRTAFLRCAGGRYGAGRNGRGSPSHRGHGCPAGGRNRRGGGIRARRRIPGNVSFRERRCKADAAARVSFCCAREPGRGLALYLNTGLS